MATSGTTDFTQSGDDLIADAFRAIGVVAEEENPTASQTAIGRRYLNRMIKSWQANGIRLWKYKEFVVFLEDGKAEYLLGSTGDRAALADNFVQTSLTTDEASGSGSIEVGSIASIADTYVIGIVQDDDTIHWTTVNGAPAGLTVTLTASTTAAASSGNHVYVYSVILERPLRITAGRLRLDGDVDIPITEISRQSYFGIPNKTNKGNPTQYYYNPLLVNGKLYAWPAGDDLQQTLRMTGQFTIEDFDNVADTPDLPQEWLECIVFNLARRLMPQYGTKGERRAEVKELAAESFSLVNNYDVESADITFQPYYTADEGWE